MLWFKDELPRTTSSETLPGTPSAFSKCLALGWRCAMCWRCTWFRAVPCLAIHSGGCDRCSGELVEFHILSSCTFVLGFCDCFVTFYLQSCYRGESAEKPRLCSVLFLASRIPSLQSYPSQPHTYNSACMCVLCLRLYMQHIHAEEDRAGNCQGLTLLGIDHET